MLPKSDLKRAIAFIDGQNLFHAAREAFGYTFPNYAPQLLAQAICRRRGWILAEVRFYTGVPREQDDPFWFHFWTSKLGTLGHAGVRVYSRALKYRNKIIRLPDDSLHSVLVGDEKGIDVRIALDIIRLANRREFDVALVFSQDQDLSEVADELRAIAHEQERWIKMASAFPSSPTSANARGIQHTDWIPIDRALYDQCIDPRDYRSKRKLAA